MVDLRLQKTPKKGESRIYTVLRRYDNFARRNEYELLDAEMFVKLDNQKMQGISSGAHYHNNFLYGCLSMSSMNSVYCTIWADSPIPLEINGVYEISFDKNPVDCMGGIPKAKIIKKYQVNQKRA